MRARASFTWILAATAALAFGFFGVAAVSRPLPVDLADPRASAEIDVDVELVLAVDISYSMDLDELTLQREGYQAALTSEEFLNAIKDGTHGKIAVTYVEWAGANDQRVVVPWQVIDGPASAERFAVGISAAPVRRSYRTSISGALLFSAPLFDGNGYRGIRRVIDVSGDGTNNQGQLVVVARDEAVAKGITINGLPLLLKRPNFATMDLPDLDVYYEDCVVGGPGAFVVPVQSKEKFREAIRTKLVLEIAGRQPHVIRVAADAPRIPCTIGERMWQERWGDGLDRQ
jgi:hypothetical protein